MTGTSLAGILIIAAVVVAGLVVWLGLVFWAGPSRCQESQAGQAVMSAVTPMAGTSVSQRRPTSAAKGTRTAVAGPVAG